jgi:formylglycine-generating enzyme required for sulfatase activity
MVYLSGGSIWVDVYLASDDGAGGALSKHMTMPLNGDDLLTWYNAVQRMLVSGKRLLSYSEFVEAAFGSPQGTADGSNINAWSVGSSRQYTGYVERAVSSVGCRDCAGNLWEWLDEFVGLGVGDEIWQDAVPGYGQLWLNGQNNEFRALLAGGSYFNGARCGSRAVTTRFSPWQSNPSFGARGACNGI